MSFTVNKEIATFGGKLLKLSHESKATNTKMDVNVYLPAQYENDPSATKIPVLLYLSGLECTPNNASEKAFWQPFANKYGFAVVFPDTSPRGANVEGEDETWYLGTAASFYVDSTTSKWSKNYKMYSYINDELQSELASYLTKLDFNNISISGHSMGGYGALMIFLKNPSKYKTVSAFSPVANVHDNKWSELCFANYLGQEKSSWDQYDILKLIKSYNGPTPEILIHLGTKDPFLNELKSKLILDASKGTKFEGKVDYNFVEGYDHSYYYVSSFVDEHAKHHAKYLGLADN
ncbi:hypothetical protein PACTADRAFT_48185 [Pachysolen tannophilus NRRL Y-2460]|uniref:S-formylglutathione hydrolase n=1 Tax=Pachysolen tannophilus NRRL Y-2460 TaxID=669874 RepID=A0A1E4U340_PACTA|nr:hypothetical protein PACTADRAFT_48185 [Pachysolen tannophilus NRRL Y-2460]